MAMEGRYEGFAALLIFAAMQMPSILVEAFNPVTTNIAIIALSVILLAELQQKSVSGQSGQSGTSI